MDTLEYIPCYNGTARNPVRLVGSSEKLCDAREEICQ